MKLKMLTCTVVGDGFTNIYAVLAGADQEADKKRLKIKVAEEFCKEHWGDVQNSSTTYEDLMNKDLAFDMYFDEHDKDTAHFADLVEDLDSDAEMAFMADHKGVYCGRRELKHYEGFKTGLPKSIRSIEEACAFLRDLWDNQETWHCEDDPADCFEGRIGHDCAQHLRGLMQQIYNLPGNRGSVRDMMFDPCGFILTLMNPSRKSDE